jgi:leucyl aminopeptidase (aminopeptidase T)
MASLKLKRAVNTLLKDFIGLYEDETVLIIADDRKHELGQAMHDSAKKICEEVFYLELKAKDEYTYEPPDILRDSMKSVDVVINTSGMNFYDTKALMEVASLGVRVGLVPNINEESLSRCLGIDHEKITDISENIKTIIEKSKIIRIETRSGTGISIPIEGQPVTASTGVLKAIGDNGYIPSGKVFVVPENGKINGMLNIDGSIEGIGLVTSPVKLEIVDSYVTKIHGDGPEAKALLKILNKYGDDARIIGEFGIGTNYKAVLSGEYYEDELSAGTAYISLGRNINIGGRNDIQFRLGCVFNRPNIFIDEELTIHNGKYIG